MANKKIVFKYFYQKSNLEFFLFKLKIFVDASSISEKMKDLLNIRYDIQHYDSQYNDAQHNHTKIWHPVACIIKLLRS
jgi:hypothetical protein